MLTRQVTLDMLVLNQLVVYLNIGLCLYVYAT